MKRIRMARLLALAMAVALALPVAGAAEELGEISLYDPLVHADDGLAGADVYAGQDAGEEIAPAQEAPLPEAPAAEEPVPAEPAPAAEEPVPAEPAPAAEEPVPAEPVPAAEESVPAEPTPADEQVDVAEPAPVAEEATPAEPAPAAEEAAPAEPAPDEANAEPTVDPEAEPTDDPDAEVAAPEMAQFAATEQAPDLVMGVGEQYAPDYASLLKGAGAVAGLVSSDPETVEIDVATGALLARKIGAAQILVTSDTGENAVYRVAVMEAPQDAAFDVSAVLLGRGETRALQLKLPEGSASAQVVYASSKPSVVTVDANGNIYGRKTGKAWISATTYNGKRAYCKVVVWNAPNRVALSAATMAVCVDETAKLRASLPKKTASALTWTSSDPAVLTVDADGGLRGVAPGSATVTVTTFNGRTASCAVTVLAGKPPTQLTLNASGLWLGAKEGFQLAPAIGEGEETVYTYVTSNRKIVAISQNGYVYARKKGTAKIAVWTHNGLYKVIKVKVSSAPKAVALSAKSLVLNAGQTTTLYARVTKRTYSQLTWTSSDEAVAAVDGSGNVTAVGPGSATIAVSTYNGRRAYCRVTVLAGAPPTTLTLNATTLQMGLKEQFLLSPTVGAGEEALYAFASSKSKVAAVSQDGVIYARKKGTAKIAVRTHNGLSAVVTVQVYAAPAKIALSASQLRLQAGQTSQLTYRLSSGASSQIAWTSSDASVASVDENGVVTALRDGTAVITAATYNGVNASCTVTVGSAPSADNPSDTAAPVTLPPDKTRMVANLRADNSLGLGGKKEAIAGVVELLISNGFEPAFAAGVASNIYSEGTYGLFESSKYVSSPQKRPRYFAYLDGGDFYAMNGGKYVLSAVYLSPEEYETYTGTATKYLRFGEKDYYLTHYSKKYAQDVNLDELEAFLAQLSKGGWKGKFGLGVVQWTGGRTKTLVGFYRKHAGSGSSITKAQVIAAENEMILYELKGAYKSVYTTWLNSNSNRATVEAANSAGALVCTKYEVPASKESKAITRGAKAAAIYKVMIGG